MKRNDVLFLLCLFLVSVLGLALLHAHPALALVVIPAITDGADGVLWQVQTTFLSVGFAGLAIAAQLFAEAPTAVGASRNRVLDHVRAGWFVGAGLSANFIIGIETAWLPSPIGAAGVALLWFAPTMVLLVNSSVRLVALFGNPSRLDEIVRTSLVETLVHRLDLAARAHADAQRRLSSLSALGIRSNGSTVGSSVLDVPIPRVGLIVKGVKPQSIRRALALLAPTVQPGGINTRETSYVPAQINLVVELGERTRFRQTAFRIVSDQPLSDDLQQRLIQVLQQSLDFEPAEFVTPDEETDREISNLKDAIGVSLRTGAFGTAKRALDLLASVVRGVWTARPEIWQSSKQFASKRRDWLFRSIWEVEQDALLSPRSADLFVTQAMTRAIEAPKSNSIEYVEECLRSFEHLWSELLVSDDDAFKPLLDRICTCLQNLAEFSFSFAEQHRELQTRVVWTFVSLVKASLDARRPDAALRAARELAGLFEFGEHKQNGRANVRGGQLVLSGWIRYLDSKKDKRAASESLLRNLLSPAGSKEEILAARDFADAASSYSRWDWWEMSFEGSRRAQVLQIDHYVDLAELSSLAGARGRLPAAKDQATASTYERLMRLGKDVADSADPQISALLEALSVRVLEWQLAEHEQLRREPISQVRVAKIATSLREAIHSGGRLAELIPMAKRVPSHADKDRPILGMNIRVPRDFLVDRVFNNTYADSADLGHMIARGFTEAEDARIVGILRSLSPSPTLVSETELVNAIRNLGTRSENYVLLTPYGGLLDFDEWRSRELADAIKAVRRIETSALEDEAILFDIRTSIRSVREPETKDGMKPVDGTMIAMGVFDDVVDSDEPEVRVESGEYFVVWQGPRPRVARFISPSADSDDLGQRNRDA